MSFLFPRIFEPSRPPLEFTLDLPPTAHKETKFGVRPNPNDPTKKFHSNAFTDVDKRNYMIKAANMLRDYHRYFLGVRYLQMECLFICERPTEQPLVGIPSADWHDPSLELLRCSRPDLDNYEKSLQDILSNHIIQKERRSETTFTLIKPEIKGAGIIDDDSCIVSKISHKIYARRREKPRIEIIIREIDYVFKRRVRK